MSDHQLIVPSSKEKASCLCGEKFDRNAKGLQKWFNHVEIQRLLPHIRKAAVRELQARAEVEEMIVELVKLGASSYIVQEAVGNKDDGTALISTSSIQRIAKDKMVQSPRRRRR